MRFTEDQLRDKALYALEKVYEQSQQAPVEPSELLRFALAYLCNGVDDRTPFDEFWRIVTGQMDEQWGPQLEREMRCANGRMNLLLIYKALGLTRPTWIKT